MGWVLIDCTPMSFYQPHPTLTHWGETLLPELCASHYLTPEQIGITWLVYGGGVRVNTGGALDPQTFWQQRPWGWSHRGEVNSVSGQYREAVLPGGGA